MTPSELKQLRRELLTFKRFTVVSDDMRKLIEEEWPDLVDRLPPKEPTT